MFKALESIGAETHTKDGVSKKQKRRAIFFLKRLVRLEFRTSEHVNAMRERKDLNKSDNSRALSRLVAAAVNLVASRLADG